MIEESAAATPYGIFPLGDDYLQAARLCLEHTTAGPVRLLAYHSAELFLKTHLRSHGWLIEELRALQHDLPKMAEACQLSGLRLKKEVTKLLQRAQKQNDYVRVRYVVTEARADILPAAVVALATLIRESVRMALHFDEFGNPQRELWAAGKPPEDYPALR